MIVAGPAHDETAAQKADVLKVLEELGVDADRPLLEVLNKIDLLEPEQREGLLSHNGRQTGGRGFGPDGGGNSRTCWPGSRPP